MSGRTFFVTESALRNLKARAQRGVCGVSSSHMSEAVAAALGFKSHAALRAALSVGVTAEVQKPDNARLAVRLRQLGYQVPDGLRLLPELDRSYSPFRTYSLRKKRGVRWMAWRNLMVSAINAGLQQRVFGLAPCEGWWPGSAPGQNGGAPGNYEFEFAGDIPAAATVTAISGDELALHVVFQPHRRDVMADRAYGLGDGTAIAHGWLERRLGAWLMDGGEEFSCKRAALPGLAGATVEPMGYADQGAFIM